MRQTASLGYFGNIWVRQNVLEKEGQSYEGHTHHFDHVSLLTSGKAKVEVEGHPPKIFEAPTFIVIRKDFEHKFTALEDNTVWFCLFALRDINGEVIDDLYGPQHDPLDKRLMHEWRKFDEEKIAQLLTQHDHESSEEYQKRMLELEALTTLKEKNAQEWNKKYKEKLETKVKENSLPADSL